MNFRANRDTVDRAMFVAEVVCLGVAYVVVGCTVAAAFAVWSFALVVF